MLEAANFPSVLHPLHNKSRLHCCAMTAKQQCHSRALPCPVDCTGLRADQTLLDGRQCHLHSGVIFVKCSQLLCELQERFNVNVCYTNE